MVNNHQLLVVIQPEVFQERIVVIWDHYHSMAVLKDGPSNLLQYFVMITKISDRSKRFDEQIENHQLFDPVE